MIDHQELFFNIIGINKSMSSIHNKAFLFCIVVLIIPHLFFFSGCENHGLSPNDASADPGFGGIITFISALPPSDSLKDLRVVAFRNYPPQNIILDVTSGKAVYTDSTIAQTSVTVRYQIQNSNTIGMFKYIVVVQQYGTNIFTDWRVVGVYSKINDKTVPGSIEISGNSFLDHIDIPVDFYNLPPQPF